MSSDGFFKLPNWVVDDSDLDAHELLVYTVLLRFRDPKSGKCFPGMGVIADRARLSRETVKRTIPRLETKGWIRINKRKVGGKNFPNEYTVALASETPKEIWSKSARGTRVPKRPGRHSQIPPEEVGPEGRHSQTPGRHSQTPGVGTGSASIKTQVKKTQEQDVRREQKLEPDGLLTFTVEEKATEKQIDYLSDLYIFVTEQIPQQRTRDTWTALTSNEASELIATYWGQIGRGRGGHWESNVDETHSAFKALSTRGRRWVVRGYLPDDLDAA